MIARALILVLGLTVAGGTPWAQYTQTVSLTQRSHDVFELTPTNAGHTYSFSVAETSRLIIDVTSNGDGLDVHIESPLGALDPADFDRFSLTAADTPPLGAVLFEPGEHVQAVIVAPETGTWTVSLTLPQGASSTLGSITTVASEGFGVAATASRPYYQAGETVVLSMLAFNGSQPIEGATVHGGFYQVGSELHPTPVSLLDDGVEPDSMAGDGLYTGAIEGLPAGAYLAELTLTTNADSASAATDFEVLPRIGYFDRTFDDVGVDTNGDGMFDYVRVDLGVDLAEAATYEVFAQLSVPNTEVVLQGGTRVTLDPGIGTASLRFEAADLREYLSVDGPWQLQDVRLVRVGDGENSPDVLADHVDVLGLTDAYTLDMLQRPLTLILDGITDQAFDTNGNGLYDVLNVSFQVDTLRSGIYTWTGDLRAPDGTNLGVAAGRGSLGTGVSSVSFSFDGRPIGAAGLDGPYVVSNVAVYGPANAAAVAEEVGSTSAYLSTQFEGGQVTFDRLIEEVQALIITGPGGIPRADGIRASLLKKAQNAQTQAEQDRPAADNILAAFISEVEAQRDVHIASEDAEQLIDLATALRATL